jgi:hypothetical protein
LKELSGKTAVAVKSGAGWVTKRLMILLQYLFLMKFRIHEMI